MPSRKIVARRRDRDSARRRARTAARAAERLRRGRLALLKGQRTRNADYTGPAIIDLIAARGTWEQCAKAIGASTSAVSRYLAGTREPSFSRGLLLSEYLKVDPWALEAWLRARREARRTGWQGRESA